MFLLQDHGKFVQSVRFSPNGEKFATGGFDGKIFVYNGSTSDLDKELGNPAHKGGIYAVCTLNLFHKSYMSYSCCYKTTQKNDT